MILALLHRARQPRQRRHAGTYAQHDIGRRRQRLIELVIGHDDGEIVTRRQLLQVVRQRGRIVPYAEIASRMRRTHAAWQYDVDTRVAPDPQRA